MTITQDALIKQVADREDINVATVRAIFKSTEDVIFDHLSSTPPSEEMCIKPFSGFTIKRKYIKEKKYSKGMFKDLRCGEHVKITSNVSRYYNDQINDQLF